MEAIKLLPTEFFRKNPCILISPEDKTYYSGLMPRYILGDLTEVQISIACADFSRAKGLSLIQGKIKNINLSSSIVTLETGEPINFDILSLNLGGVPTPIATQCPQSTLYLRPFSQFVERWEKIQKIFETHESPHLVVVGGGAAAIEVATALRLRLNRQGLSAGQVSLVTSSDRLAPNYSLHISNQLLLSLRKNNIDVYLNNSVDRIGDHQIQLTTKETLNFDAVFLALPNQSSPLLTLKGDDTLRVHPTVFSLGDGAHYEPPFAKSGVVAVHQGRYLAKALKSLVSGDDPPPFHLPKHLLNILITGQDSARAVFGPFAWDHRLMRTFKDYIDDRYMNSFKESRQPKA